MEKGVRVTDSSLINECGKETSRRSLNSKDSRYKDNKEEKEFELIRRISISSGDITGCGENAWLI